MHKLRHLIPSPAALFAFEAAGRLLSFTKAGAELNVSQAAISQSVKQLEAALGVQLFRRLHRALVLTEAGERLHGDVVLGLSHIQRSVEGIARPASDRHVTLSCSTAFANYWMLPRLGRFRAANPDIDIRLQTTDRDVDLVAEGIPLGIRHGTSASQWPGCKAALLTRETVYPVASPAYLDECPAPPKPPGIAAHRLIHLDEPFRKRLTWSDWFRAHGVPWQDPGHGLRLNDYALVLQACIAGEGVAMGWAHIVDALIAQGLLRYVLLTPFASPGRFWVVWPANRPLGPHAERMRDWLLETFRQPLSATGARPQGVIRPPSPPGP